MANSEDESTKTGVALVRPWLPLPFKPFLAFGTNHFPENFAYPEGMTDPEEQRMYKRDNIIHGETDGFANALERWGYTRGLIMFSFWMPCAPCAHRIVDAEISHFIAHEEMVQRTPEDWRDSLEEALEILNVGGVDVRLYTGKIGGVHHLMRHKYWEP